jgi:hypothetical protein
VHDDGANRDATFRHSALGFLDRSEHERVGHCVATAMALACVHLVARFTGVANVQRTSSAGR